MIKPFCSCAEVFGSDEKPYALVPKWHNCQYILSRNELLEEAERIATDAARLPNGEEDPKIFNEMISLVMDRLASQHGLV